MWGVCSQIKGFTPQNIKLLLFIETVNLMACVSLGLIRLLGDGDREDHLMSLSPEQVLLRWVNHHLRNAGTKTISNFSEDIKVPFRAHTHTQLHKQCTQRV